MISGVRAVYGELICTCTFGLVGGVVSTINVVAAGVGSVLVAISVALTSNI